MVILFFGLSGSGKSTLAKALCQKYNPRCVWLDGDSVRRGLNSDLGLSIDDRKENIRRIAEMAKLIHDQGQTIIISAICPTNEIRNNIKDIIGEKSLYSIYVSTPLEVCKERDVKGLYASVGDDMTGIKSVFEEPESYDLKIDTTDRSIQSCINEINNALDLHNFPTKAIKKYNYFYDNHIWVLNYRFKYATPLINNCDDRLLRAWCKDDNTPYFEHYVNERKNRLPVREIGIINSVDQIPEGFVKFAVYRDPLDRFYASCHYPGYDAREVIKEFTDYVDDNGVCIDPNIKRQSDVYDLKDVDYVVNHSDLKDFLNDVFGDEYIDFRRKPIYPSYEDVDLTLSDKELQRVKDYYSKDYEIGKSDKVWKK